MPECVLVSEPVWHGETCPKCGFAPGLARWFDGGVIHRSPMFPSGQRSLPPVPHPGQRLPIDVEVAFGIGRRRIPASHSKRPEES